MTLQQLQQMRTLSQTLSYDQAAQALGLPQATLRQAQAELEQELGATLFYAQGQALILSEAGELFLEQAAAALDKLQAAKKAVADYEREQASSVSVGYIFSLAQETQRLINGFLEQPENQELQVRQFLAHSSIAVNATLLAGKSDLAFCVDPPQGCFRQLVEEQELLFAVPKGHPLAAQRGPVRLEQLVREPLVLVGEGTNLRSTILRFFAQRGIPLTHCVEAESCNEAAARAAAGEGYTLLPTGRNFAQNGLAVLQVQGCRIVRPIYMVWRQTAEREAVARFRRYACQAFGLTAEPQ